MIKKAGGEDSPPAQWLNKDIYYAYGSVIFSILTSGFPNLLSPQAAIICVLSVPDLSAAGLL